MVSQFKHSLRAAGCSGSCPDHREALAGTLGREIRLISLQGRSLLAILRNA